MKMAVLAYLRRNNKTLMLYRNKKKNDVHLGKWNGLGGKLEKGEMPEDALKREVKEESGFLVEKAILRGVITFPDFSQGEDWFVYLYDVSDFSGKIIECNEGELHWIDDKKITQLNMWEGDYLFFSWMKSQRFFSAKISYRQGKLIDHCVFFY